MPSDEVKDAVGAAPDDRPAVPKKPPTTKAALKAKRQELAAAELALDAARRDMAVDAEISEQQRVNILRGHIAALEAQWAQEEEAACRDDARARLVAIKRAAGSHRAEIQDLVARGGLTHSDLRPKVEEWCRRIRLLAMEGDALADRFALERPDVLAEAWEAIALRHPSSGRVEGLDRGLANLLASDFPQTETCEHGLRTRRTYGEVAGTPAAEIIQRAGLRPWPPLTEKQERIVAARKREQAEAAAQMAALPQVPSWLHSATGGSVSL